MPSLVPVTPTSWLPQMMTTATPLEISEGKTLNVFLPFIQQLMAKGIQGPPVPLDPYALSRVGVTMGGTFTKYPHERVPFWLYYFNVADVAQAAARVRAGGGRIAQGPTELPDGSWIVRCIDPQGAIFALQGRSSQRDTEQPAVEIDWSSKWGGFASRGKMIIPPQRKPKR